MFHTYYVIFSDISTLFPAQNFKTKGMTVQKNTFIMSAVEQIRVMQRRKRTGEQIRVRQRRKE